MCMNIIFHQGGYHVTLDTMNAPTDYTLLFCIKSYVYKHINSSIWRIISASTVLLQIERGCVAASPENYIYHRF